jgi:hypothetical protein
MGVEQRKRDDQQELTDEVDFKIVLARQVGCYSIILNICDTSRS